MQNKKKKNMKKRRGFTLMELLLVMFIICVMISVGVLYIRKSKGGNDRHTVANVMITMIRQAKEIAVARNAMYRVNFDTGKMTVKITDSKTGKIQIGKAYYIPENVKYPKGKFPPVFIEIRPTGNFNPLTVKKIYLEERNNPGLYDRIDLIEETGQTKLIKDTNI